MTLFAWLVVTNRIVKNPTVATLMKDSILVLAFNMMKIVKYVASLSAAAMLAKKSAARADMTNDVKALTAKNPFMP